MRHLLIAIALLFPCMATAQTVTVPVARTAGGTPILATPTICLKADGTECASGGSASGSPVAGTPTRIAGSDGTNTRDIIVSTTGVFDSPRAGTANRVVTKTNLALNTSTTICPAAASAISTEIFFTTGGVGISLAGGTLTTATIGTTASTTPDLSFATAATLYTMPVSPTNAITAYGAAGIVVCIQNLRQ